MADVEIADSQKRLRLVCRKGGSGRNNPDRASALAGPGASSNRECVYSLIFRVFVILAGEIEHMLGSATRTMRPHDAFMHGPVTVANLDVDPAPVVIGRQQHRRILAMTFPPVDGGDRPVLADLPWR